MKIGQKDVLHAFAHLPAETLAKLHELLRVQTFAAGEQIFAQGVMSSAFYIVAKGQVKITRLTHEGHESIVCMREPGEFFCPVAILDGGSELGTAVPLTETMVLWADRESFVNLCHERPGLLALVQDACLGKVRHLIQRLEIMAFHNVRERLIHTLLVEVTRQASGTPNDVVLLTQQELGTLIGASRESVSRVLTELQREGLVSLGRGRVVISDRQQLALLLTETGS